MSFYKTENIKNKAKIDGNINSYNKRIIFIRLGNKL